MDGVTYDFHHLPSGLINPEYTNLIGSGVVVHVSSFFTELNDLETKGLQHIRETIFISDRAHVVFDLHQLVECVLPWKALLHLILKLVMQLREYVVTVFNRSWLKESADEFT